MNLDKGKGFLLQLFELSSFCKAARSMLQVAGDAHPAFGLKAEGYCSDFAYRQAIIAELVLDMFAENVD